MSELFGVVFDEIRYMRFLYFALLAIALWGALRAGPRRPARPAVLALLALLLLSSRPVVWALNAALESPYRPAPSAAGEIDAIVVYSGGSFLPAPGQEFSYLESGTNLRCRMAARIHERSGRPPVVVCGNSPDEAFADPVWDLMARELEAWGVPENRIAIERRGRSTYEQSLYAAEILRGLGARRVAVVTEGFHMRRAAGCMERLGFEVFPAPAGSRAFPAEMEWRDFVPSAAAIGDAEEAIREIAALAVYKLRGRI